MATEHCFHDYSGASMGQRNVRCCYCGAAAVQHAKPMAQPGHGPYVHVGEEWLPVNHPEPCRGKRESKAVELIEQADRAS